MLGVGEALNINMNALLSLLLLFLCQLVAMTSTMYGSRIGQVEIHRVLNARIACIELCCNS